MAAEIDNALVELLFSNGDYCTLRADTDVPVLMLEGLLENIQLVNGELESYSLARVFKLHIRINASVQFKNKYNHTTVDADAFERFSQADISRVSIIKNSDVISVYVPCNGLFKTSQEKMQTCERQNDCIVITGKLS